MGSTSSHKPDLIRYFRLAIRWIKRAWDLYRVYELIEALVEAA